MFGDRNSGAYLHKLAWTRIIRHQMVKGAASPDDPALTEYWAKRRRKAPPPPIGKTSLRLYEAQTAAARSAGARSCPTTTCHKTHTSGNNGWSPPARRSSTSPRGRMAHRTRPNPVSYTPTANTDSRTAAGRRFCPPASLLGLLEPDAARPLVRF